MEGWISLHRKFVKWEWYDDLPVKIVFLHLLLMANHKDGNHRGVAIKRGQYKTGRNKLAEETGLKEQQVRTALKKLKSTQELTIKSYSKYSIITITKYDEYQNTNQQKPKKQPATNQQLTTNNNDNKKNNENKIVIPDFVLSEFKEDFARMKLHRLEKKKPMTSGAETLLHNTMIKFKAAGCNITELVDYSIMKGYETIYMPDNKKEPTKPAKPKKGYDLTNPADVERRKKEMGI